VTSLPDGSYYPATQSPWHFQCVDRRRGLLWLREIAKIAVAACAFSREGAANKSIVAVELSRPFAHHWIYELSRRVIAMLTPTCFCSLRPPC